MHSPAKSAAAKSASSAGPAVSAPASSKRYFDSSRRKREELGSEGVEKVWNKFYARESHKAIRVACLIFLLPLQEQKNDI